MISKKYAKTVWHAMHQRCNPAFKHYTGATVSPEWSTFEPFYAWAVIHYVEGYQLDKDLTVLGNTLYGPHTCCFVPGYINKLLTSSSATRGRYPIGVHGSGRSYRASCRMHGIQVDLGSHKTPMQAHRAWQHAKARAVNESVMIYVCGVHSENVAHSLLNVADRLIHDAVCQVETISLIH